MKNIFRYICCETLVVIEETWDEYLKGFDDEETEKAVAGMLKNAEKFKVLGLYDYALLKEIENDTRWA